MLFNSLDFIVFFPIVFILYWLLRNRLKLQNLFLIIASYVFYGWWDYRFLSLIFLTTVLDFFTAIQVDSSEEPTTRKFWVGLSITVNLSVLFFFKYYNFFVDSWIEAFRSIGYTMDVRSLNIILPVGVSFYTFQTMSYTIDVYRKQLHATRDFTTIGCRAY